MLQEVGMHFTKDWLCKSGGVRQRRTGERLQNLHVGGSWWRQEEGGGGGTTTFLLHGEKRQHSVGEEERVDSN